MSDYTGPRTVSSVTEARGRTVATVRGESEQDKAASDDAYEHPDHEGPRHPSQLERREHWRKPDRDDRGPESRLLPVEERDGTHSLAYDRSADKHLSGGVTPQLDDPHGKGYAGEHYEGDPQVKHTVRSFTAWGRNENSGDPHPDDPYGLGFHGDHHEEERAARSAAAHDFIRARYGEGKSIEDAVGAGLTFITQAERDAIAVRQVEWEAENPDKVAKLRERWEAIVAEAASRIEGPGSSQVTHPSNAMPGHPALTNVGTIYDNDPQTE